ncbi:MAG: hypothetical protein WCQ64_11145 [Acidobacteriota bacterium]
MSANDTKRMPRLGLFAAVVLVYVLAWFLPVHTSGKTLRDGVLPGWEAFSVALDIHGEEDWGVVSATIARASALTNLLMVGAMVLLLRRGGRVEPRRWLAWAFVAATIIDLWWARGGANNDRSDLLWGYWLWMSSFALMAAWLFITRQRRA